MRRFLWIRTKGGKGGNTRRVHNALVAEEPLLGGNMRRMGGNTRRGRMCGICRRLRVPGNLWRTCVESVGDALFGGNMRRFLWIRTKGGKGGKGGGNRVVATREVHRTAFRLHVSDTAFSVLVAEEALFGGNMRGVRSRSIIFDAC